METGRKILNLRLDRGLEQQELARACGMSTNSGALSKIESGSDDLRVQTAVRIARALCVPFEYLVDPDWPYPHRPPVIEKPGRDAKEKVRLVVTEEEKAILERFRQTSKPKRAVAHAVLGASLETLVVSRAMEPAAVDPVKGLVQRRSDP